MNLWLNPVVNAYIEYFGTVNDPIVWEVGSRDGHDGVELARRIWEGNDFSRETTVVCMEPNPDQVSVIKKNYPWVDVIEMAASNKNGKAKFMVYEGDEGAVGSSSLNLRWKEDDLPGHIIHVKTVRLEKILPEGEIDIMKIDVEGHSLEVLQGIGNRIRDVRVYHIETEKWSGSDKAVEGIMDAAGFKLVSVQEEWGGMPDQVWVRV